MDYEKKYKEALERAKKLHETCDSQAVVGWCEYIFHELYESEDERIRKTLINFFQDWHKNRSHCWGISVPEILAWLEKQGEQKSSDEDMKEALRTEYEKGRADVIADTISWLENCWPRCCSNQTIIDGFKEAIGKE